MFLILLGPPGTGKGTQAKLIADRLGLLHVATGDLFREAVQRDSQLGRTVKAYMDRGELVPDEVTIGALEERIARPDAEKGVVFDGFPRTLGQARALDEMLARRDAGADLALHVAASDDEIVRRLSGRWLCPNCGEIYHELERPPGVAGRCDNCGSELSQREDDRPEVVRRRLAVQRPPGELLDHYRAQGKLIEIDGEQPVEAVTRDLLAAIAGAGAARPAGKQ
jgi:adenylate kinase